MASGTGTSNNVKALSRSHPHGDWSFRCIPTDVETSDLTITHTYYNHVDTDRAEAIGEALDAVVRTVQTYKAYMEGRLAQESASSTPMQGLAGAYRLQISRLDQLLGALDGDILGQATRHCSCSSRDGITGCRQVCLVVLAWPGAQ
jgi:hypothetical protein